MSDPWTVLGWLSVAVAVLALLLFLIVAAVFAFYADQIWYREYYLPWRRYMKTRNVKPAAGQVWSQRGQTLRIKYIVADTGRIVIEAGNASWSDSPEEWQRRVKNARCYLVHEGKNGR